ncbi:MAG: hypothetical protein ACD_69C00047G0002 [uncultured bacterium]|nr:MAG: hypothetical protein ACD_69C00047G0002 [uncultured bacterium]
MRDPLGSSPEDDTTLVILGQAKRRSEDLYEKTRVMEILVVNL